MDSIGTEEYIRRLVEEYGLMLLKVAMTRLHSSADAEDAVQEVFLRLLTARPHFRDTVFLAAYEGCALSSAFFQMADDGSISFTDTVAGPHVLFPLPLDAANADPAAVEQFLSGNDIEP